MIDERYHIYSIAAVFLALAVGIVIGTTMSRSPAGQSEKTTIRQYEAWMTQLRGEIEDQSKENARMANVARRHEEFCQAAMPILADDRLAWRNAAIIRTGDYDEITGSTKRALELAGAQVTTVTEISRNFPFGDEEKIGQVLANCGVKTPTDGEKPSAKLWRIIAGAVSGAQHAYLLPKLERAGVAKFTGTYDRPARLVVLVGGASSDETNTAEVVDAPLVAQANRPGITIVGSEPGEATSSFVATWRKMGIATVDNAETSIGQICLICALNGEQASFGTKDSADRMIPQTLEQP